MNIDQMKLENIKEKFKNVIKDDDIILERQD